MKKLAVLILDDEQRITDTLAEFLQKQNFVIFTANLPGEAFQVLKKHKIDIIITDVMMPQMNGIEVMRKVKKINSALEVILISGHGNMNTVIDAMRLGAIDFIPKPFKLYDVQMAIQRTEKFLNLQTKLQKVEDHYSLISREMEGLIERDFIGISKSIQDVLEMAMTAAQNSDVNVLITGENGTGKEIIARIIHHASVRKKNPFYPVNSSAIPETLLESEFFGHIKGSFTGASENKKGCFELADGGTLFLDEIADMPLKLQSKILRAIEEKKIKPVGSNKEISVDIRIISATNKNLNKLIEKEKFRQDLFYRINAFSIEIPPLRERIDDIKPLLENFISQFSKKQNRPAPVIPDEVLNKLQKYHFPGNVRELKNMVQRALMLNSANTLKVEDFNCEMQNIKVNNSIDLDANERKLILTALDKTDFNQTKAARLLGISRDALKRKIIKHQIEIKKTIV
ncbi:MAG: sigma-54 dependent transcriptional regulator [Candidatus Cloacimonetes bacterium]|nr:sigma-54 dependent transcriptional regulator [Candidatus Cloacimonadota bacterium]MCF7814171.1 sigma-54 dependent transcriptional regulator [Candidatus Cloacimonadota bacterium]MCF7868766.1 sigma-54 dependent transcriptional regulator [Candidatus Cloacimonadota bacterium]MCF7884169.1 sigma-54 dependent transcriptional regulator [Candidatus Cloacimonadota bacterium]